MLSPTQMLSIKVQTKNRPVHMHVRVFFSTGLSAPLVQRFTDTNMSRHRHTSRPEPIAWPLMRTTEFYRTFEHPSETNTIPETSWEPHPIPTVSRPYPTPHHAAWPHVTFSRSRDWILANIAIVHLARPAELSHPARVLCLAHNSDSASTQLFDDVLSDHDHDGSHTPSIQLPTWVAVRTHVRHQKKHHTRCGYHDRERTILLNLDSGRPVAYPTSFIT